MTVFITDADYKHTLGVIRRLSRRGVKVIAGATTWRAQGFFSRYCSNRVIHPPASNPDAFAEFMIDYLRQHDVDVLLPIGYTSAVAASLHAKSLSEYTHVPVAEYESMLVAADKARTMEFASVQGVRVPQTYAEPSEVDRYPVVVKSAGDGHRLRYINSPGEFAEIDTAGQIIQEYVPGEGYGFYALYRHCEMRACFMHHRLREYPATGGASTAAESIYDPVLRELGERLLDGLKWHGVAMVEFKKDARDGSFVLMEINPKFWGSLDLSAAAGIDFAWLTTQMAMNTDEPAQCEYPTGIRCHWLLPDDLLHAVSNPSSLWPVVRDTINPRVHGNIDLRDPLPNLFQLGMTGVKVAGRVLSGTLRRPHGVPEVDA
jgi:predicted ATP-grasp superfamily ATP-dependent carboligase